MAINKRKVLEAARKYAQKGAQAKALKEFDKLLKLDPRDARLRLEVGDAYRRWGDTAEAIETYKLVAEQYMKEGFDARAVAVYKQIQNLAPEVYESYEPLADLYQRMGLTSEAIFALQTAADGYRKEGKKREALDLLRKMTTLDPSNTTSRIKVADLLRQEERFSEALTEYVEVSAELEKQGDRDAAVSVYERILEIEPDRMETLKQLSANLLDRGLGDHAEPFVKRILELNPDEPAHYERMATVYRLQERDDELVETYRQLAALHRQRGDEEEAREILQRYVPSGGIEKEVGMDEETAFAGMSGAADLGASGSFGDSFSASADVPLSELAEATGFAGLGLDGEEPTRLDERLFVSDPGVEADDDGFLPIDDPGEGDGALELDDALEPELEVDPVAGVEPAPAHAPMAPEADPEQLFAEASVYLRYGKREQAIANLEAIVAQDGEHRGALEKLGEAHAEGGDGPKAVGLWLRSAGLARDVGDLESVAVLRDRIAAIDEAAAAELDAVIASDADATPEPPATPAEGEATVIDLEAIDSSAAAEGSEIDLDDLEIEIDDSAFSDELPAVEDSAGEDDAAVAEAPPVGFGAEDPDTDGPGSSSAVAQQIGEDLEEADFYMKQGLADEAEVIYRRVLSIAPNHPHALVRLGEAAAMRGEDPSSATRPGAPASPDPIAADGGSADLAEPEWNDAICGPDDVELAPPTLEYSLKPEVAAGSGTEAASDDEGTCLEDDLANQFLAEVTGSEDTSAASESAPATDADAGIARDVASEILADVAADTADTAEPTAPAADADESESGTGGPAREIASPDDSFADVPIDLGEAPELSVPAASAAAEEPPVWNDESFDLAAELSGVFDDESGGGASAGRGDSNDGFEAVFDAFKKGIRQTLSEGDHEAHFDLGIAYREMGLLEDAKSEFQAAMLNAAREVECRHMLGLCCLEQQRTEEAISHFEQIAASDAATEEQQLSAQFDLGRAWESLGECARARTAWEAVAAVDADFCGVSSHLAALEEAPKPEAPADFESFEDLLADATSDADDAAPPPAPDSDSNEYESFDGFLDGDDAAEPAPQESVPEPEPAPVQEASVEAPEARRPRRRKKISFV